MLNLVNKIITVILTLIVMINYCNGFINDKSVLLDNNKFTSEEIKTCEKFKEEFSQYLINNFQYFVVKRNDFYRLEYTREGRNVGIYAPFTLYELETHVNSGEFGGCKDNGIEFVSNHKPFIFKLKDIHFFKPVDRFIQPPELEDANKVDFVENCKEFNDIVVENSTTGFMIYKNRLTNSFNRFCLWQGCARNSYVYSNLPKPRSWTEFRLRSEPFGFFWYKNTSLSNPKVVYQNCADGRLHFIESANGSPIGNQFLELSKLTFYIIKSKTKRLSQIEPYSMKRLSSCKEFNQYLENHNNILDDYIYFSDIRNPNKLYYHTMRVNLYGPADFREKPYLLTYQDTNPKFDGYEPHHPSFLFLGCKFEGRENRNGEVTNKDRLLFENESNTTQMAYLELREILFYEGDEPQSDGASGFEMKVLNKKPS